MSTNPLSARLLELSALVDNRLRQQVRLSPPPFAALGAMQGYHLGWFGPDLSPLERPEDPGKRLRPAVCLLTCAALCGDVAPAVGVAAAIELLHNFSLVHDDIQDQSPTRRHRPSVWALWGTAQAINVGDALFASSMLAIAEDAALPPDRCVEAVRLLGRTSVLLVEGQYLDLALQAAPLVTLDEYEAMVGRKTAALFATSAELGAVCAGAGPVAAAAYAAFGRALGFAFQYQDDVLGVWGDERRTGKSAASDVRSGKKSLPVVLAFRDADEAQRDALRRLYALPERSGADADAVLRLFDSIGVRATVEARVGAQYAEAGARLAAAPGDPAEKALLAALIASLRGRSA